MPNNLKSLIMKRSILFFFVVSSFVHSCNNNPPRDELAFHKIIANDLFTMFPGTLRITSNHIILQNPFNKDAFLQVYNRQSGEEIISAGTIGRGPGEWNNPDISNVIHDRIAIYDAYLKQFIFTDVPTILNISNPASIQKTDFILSKFVFLNESHYIAAHWKETHPFEMISDGKVFSCGQYPFKKTVINSADCFQGILQIHPQRELLVYATLQNPYIALYRVGKENLTMTWENQFKAPQYSIVEGQLQWGKEQPDGVSDVAFTKDYIVCLVKDFKNEARGQDVAAAPKTVYVFDYKGKIIHILDLPVHSVRLASDAETNTFYSVGLEPDYCIVEYDLTSMGL